MWKEFKKFIMRGNVLDMAVGIIIGAAFGTVVTSLVNDIIMPPIGRLLGGVDFADLFINLGPGSYDTLAAAQEAGAATINYGLFINNRHHLPDRRLCRLYAGPHVNRAMEKETRRRRCSRQPRQCPECLSEIPIEATSLRVLHRRLA